ncbi:MAG: hypothetical protein IPJ98_24635 [Bryobacterales bacterium]|nr:hypothetical protein [Bryobacterales bacterium]
MEFAGEAKEGEFAFLEGEAKRPLGRRWRSPGQPGGERRGSRAGDADDGADGVCLFVIDEAGDGAVETGFLGRSDGGGEEERREQMINK